METITSMNCQFLSIKQIQTLQANNVITFLDLVIAPSDFACSALEITESEYSTIRQYALLYAQPQPKSLLEYSSSERLTPKSTGMPSLDSMLGGGLFPGDIIELFGKTGCGKTQLCLHLTAQFCHFDNDPSYVLYFDMKNEFNALRLKCLCDDKAESLGRVKIFREPNLDGLFTRLEDMKNQLIGGIDGFYSKSKLLVIDSVPMLIYPAVQQDPYSWRFYPEKLVAKLRWFADYCNLVIILVNHGVTIRPSFSSAGSSRSATSQSGIKAAMGKFWHHNINIRIHLSKLNGVSNQIVAKLEKSCRTSETKEYSFSINNKKLWEVVSS